MPLFDEMRGAEITITASGADYSTSDEVLNARTAVEKTFNLDTIRLLDNLSAIHYSISLVISSSSHQ